MVHGTELPINKLYCNKLLKPKLLVLYIDLMLLPTLFLSLKSHEFYNNRIQKLAEEGKTTNIPTLPVTWKTNVGKGGIVVG